MTLRPVLRSISSLAFFATPPPLAATLWCSIMLRGKVEAEISRVHENQGAARGIKRPMDGIFETLEREL